MRGADTGARAAEAPSGGFIDRDSFYSCDLLSS